MIQCMAASFVDEHLDLIRIDDFLIVDSHVVEQPRHIYFLLEVTAFKIGVRLAGERQHRSLIKFRVVQAIE